MKKKICFLINKNFLQFGIAKYFQSNSDFELYALIDDDPNLKNFFEKQNFVKFQKTLYINDFSSDKKPDVDYLKKIEKNYKINLWDIAYTDRIFYSKYNKFYKFSHDEILSIIERDCKCFENIFDTINPDYVLIATITGHHELLFNKMSNSKNISTLSLEPVRFNDRYYVAKGVYNEDEKNLTIKKSIKKRTSKELEKFLHSHKPAQSHLNNANNKNKISKWKKSKALLQFLISEKTNNENLYSNFGKTKLNILKKGTARSHEKQNQKRQLFIDKNFIKKINTADKYVYFPLHEEPEKVLLMGAKYFTEQLSIIINIAKSLPLGYWLYVKEHPVMKIPGWRDKDYYQQIMDLPNVKLIHPNISQELVIKNCSLVVTIRGTVAIESTILQKPSIVFSTDYGWSSIPSIEKIEKFSELPSSIKKSLAKDVTSSDIDDFMEFVENISFDFEVDQIVADVAKYFQYSIGYMKRPPIDDDTMKLFLNSHQNDFNIVGSKFLEKINQLN